jgi:hypothetical protein
MRFHFRWFLFSFLCGLFSTSMASAACDYYMAPNGSDNGAGTLAAPWKTILYASGKMSPGRTLCARGGTYYGQAGRLWRSSGTASAPVTFRNYPGETPVFDGQWGNTGVGGDFLDFTNEANIVVDGLTIQHFVDQYGNGAIKVNNDAGPVSNIVIQNCTFIDNGSDVLRDHHIYLAGGAMNTTIRNNLFIRAAGAAIQLNHTPAPSGTRIYNNVMIGGTLKCSASNGNPCSSTSRQSWGMMISDGKDTQIYNNTVYGMDRGGIEFNYYTTTPAGPYIVKNNLLINTTSAIYVGAGIRVTSAYAALYSGDYNGFYGNETDISWKDSSLSVSQVASSTTNERHSIHASPSFVSAGSDFHLISSSPMIDKGVSISLFNTDKDGVARTSNASYDIGAYEYVGSAPPPPPPPPPPPAGVSVSVSSAQLSPGQVFTVTVNGADGSDTDDYVALYLASAADSDWSYNGQVKDVDGQALQFTAPMEAGTYNIRYFAASNTQNRLAVSQNLTVTVAPPPVTWTRCASENGVCSFTGTRKVRYGANGSYITKVVSGSIACTSQAFGGDPARNVVKACDYSSDTVSDSVTWTDCANEGQTCSVSGTREVRYGANGSYITKMVSGSVACTNQAFGRDPAYGFAKKCQFSSVAQ